MGALRILIADDHDVIRRGLKTLLEAHPGWKVCAEAHTGTEAVAKSQETKPDIAVLDINMPEMSGLELLPKARTMRPDVPIIMITAYGDAETRRQALESGAEALLTKPIDFGTLRSEIDLRIERST